MAGANQTKPDADQRPFAFPLPPAYRLALGFVAGAISGPMLGTSASALQPLADLLLGALEAAGPPLAAFVLLSALVAFSARNLTRFAALSIAWFMATSLFAAALGIATATALSVGLGSDLLAGPPPAGPAGGASAADWVDRWGAIVRGWPAHLGFWSLFAILVARRLFGAMDRGDGERTGLLKHCVDVTFLILGRIMLFAPVGIFALAAITFSRLKLTAAAELLRVFAAVYSGQVILCFVAAGTLIALTRSRGPFFRRIGGALLTAFATGSSAATAPVEIASANEQAGIDREVAGLIIPLGLAVSKIGTAVFIAVVLVFAAASGPVGLTLPILLWLTLLAFAASVITPPISGGALVVLGLFSSDAFLPLPAIVIAATVPLIGKMNTPINSLGRLVSARVLSECQPVHFAAARQEADASSPG